MTSVSTLQEALRTASGRCQALLGGQLHLQVYSEGDKQVLASVWHQTNKTDHASEVKTPTVVLIYNSPMMKTHQMTFVPPRPILARPATKRTHGGLYVLFLFLIYLFIYVLTIPVMTNYLKIYRNDRRQIFTVALV